MADVVKFADRMGIERFMLYLGFPPHPKDPTPEDLTRINDQVLEALQHWHHRAFGFVYLNPNHLDFSLKEFDRCVRDGPMVGVKLWVARKCNTPELDPIIERAAAMNAVIFQHTWIKVSANYPGECTSMELSELATRHPETPIICGHTGGDWEQGIRAIRANKNVSIGIAGSDPTNGFVEMAVRELGAERIIYGSDAGGRSFASQLAKVHGANIPEADKKLIFGENLKRMLGPILKRKGMSA
jgi:hypothetical protein